MRNELNFWVVGGDMRQAKLAELEALGDGVQYLVDMSLERANPSQAENFGNSAPIQLRS